MIYAGYKYGSPSHLTKVPVTLLAASMVEVHVPDPVQAPLQPENRYPLAGVAVNVTEVPLTHACEQSLPHDTPDGELLIVPLPIRLTVKVYLGNALNVAVTVLAAFIVRLQAPVPVQAPLQP